MGRRLSISGPALWIVVALLGATPPQALSAAPAGLNQQGLLVDTLGAPLNGAVDLSVRIWAHPTSTLLGDLSYLEDHLATPVVDGVYSIEIGAGSSASGPFSAALFASADRWLELVVNGEVMAPRQRLLSVAYALQAEICADAATLGGLTSANIIDTARTALPFSNLAGLIADAQVPATVTRDAEVIGLVLAGDGPGSGINADLLDGLSSAAFSVLGPTIEGAEITDLTVGTVDIANGAVTAAKLVDGTGSGVDADLVDGLNSSSFLRSDAIDTATNQITFSSTVVLNGSVNVGQDSSADDDAILFDAGGESLTWINAAARFEVSDDIGAQSFMLTPNPGARRQRIAGNAFAADVDPGGVGWNVSAAGYGNITSGVAPLSLNLAAAAYLPDGATITEFKCDRYHSSASNDITGIATLLSRSLNSTVATPHAAVDLSGAVVSTLVQGSFTTTITSPTATSDSVYWISVPWTVELTGTTARFYGCEVRYTVDQVD